MWWNRNRSYKNNRLNRYRQSIKKLKNKHTKESIIVLDYIDKLEKEIEELKKDNNHQWEERCKLTFELEKKEADIDIKDKVIDDLCFAITHEEIPQEFYCHSTSINCEMVGGTMECKECLKQAVYEEVEKVEKEKC